MQRVIVVAREIILLNRAALQPFEILCVVAGFCFSAVFTFLVAFLIAFLVGFTFSSAFIAFVDSIAFFEFHFHERI
jgi:hypothetical protein